MGQKDLKETGVLLLGFGGPARPEEVEPFVREVLRGRAVPEERVAQVLEQYRAIGGASPYVAKTLRQAEALRKLLAARGLPLSVDTAFLHSPPRLREAVQKAHREGKKNLLVIPMAPYKPDPPFDAYRSALEKETLFPFRLPPAWHLRPGFLQAHERRIRETLRRFPAPLKFEEITVLFSAHSLPAAWSAASSYVQRLKETTEALARRLHLTRFQLVFQSRSGKPEEPWLRPELPEVLKNLDSPGVLVCPLGFLVDHAEVLFDLDIAARRIAEKRGLVFQRVPAVETHPSFIALLAALVEEMFFQAASEKP